MVPTTKCIDSFVCRRQAGSADAEWVHLAGALDIATAPTLERTLHEALRDASLVVLDLRSLTFIDLTGLRVILDGARFARESGRELNLLRGPSRVDRVFALTGTAEAVNTVELDVELGQLSAR